MHCTNLEQPGLSGGEDIAAGLHHKLTWTKPFKGIPKHFGTNLLGFDLDKAKQSAIYRQATDVFGIGFLNPCLDPIKSYNKCNSHNLSL
jgi:hypothetical protein